MRGVGVGEALTGVIPEWMIPVWAAVTVIGMPELVVVAAVLVYWVGPQFEVISHRNGVRVVMVTITGLAVVAGLKQWFGLPRPPSPTIEYRASGFGFPSGHATAAATVYFAGAALADVSSRRRRWGVAVVAVGVVGVSRLVLGVHYLVDVVAGILIGAGIVAVVVAVTRDRVWPGVGVAVLAGVGAGVVTWMDPGTGVSHDVAIAVGGTVGAAVAWAVITAVDVSLRRPSIGVVVGAAIGAGGPLAWVVTTRPGIGVTMVVAGIAGGLAVGVPAIRTFRSIGRVPSH